MTTRQGDDGFAYVVVNDGKGASLVQINVQPNMSDVEDELSGSGAQTLPDGTKVVTHQGPGEKGGQGVVMWTVDTIRKDGFRVVISAFNSGAQNTAATRTTPRADDDTAQGDSHEWEVAGVGRRGHSLARGLEGSRARGLGGSGARGLARVRCPSTGEQYVLTRDRRS
ncbi:hypothetical protein [Streptomyces sp. NBC_00649]|uniref:hypothetical protein n=1 Tax=Streptomyces sp. NBC_00649 TaxID=2975798 RepID=UPI003864BA78